MSIKIASVPDPVWKHINQFYRVKILNIYCDHQEVSSCFFRFKIKTDYILKVASLWSDLVRKMEVWVYISDISFHDKQLLETQLVIWMMNIPITPSAQEYSGLLLNGFQRHYLTLWRLDFNNFEIWCLMMFRRINKQPGIQVLKFMQSLPRYLWLNITIE